VYCASKHGVVALSKCLAHDLADIDVSPQKSTTAAQVDLMAGNIEAMFDFVVTWTPHIKSASCVRWQ